MSSPRTDTSPVNTSVVLVSDDGRVTPYFKHFLDVLWTRTGGFHDLSATVTDLYRPGAPQAYLWISTDLGVTWGTTSPQSFTLRLYSSADVQVASRVITATRVNATGNITLTAAASVGLATTVTFTGNGTQVTGARVSIGGVFATLSVSSQIDSTALGGYTGGPTK